MDGSAEITLMYHAALAVFMAAFLSNVVLNLAKLPALRRKAALPAKPPRVSVLIPARNEAENIRPCLESLMAQDYPNFEVLVLNDNSSDETAVIVGSMAANDNRIRLLHGDALPPGWTGKSFACHQLAMQASGDWLLFADADTRHEPHMLRSALALALQRQASLLSGFPHQVTVGFWEKIIVPVFYLIIMCWLPLWWLQDSKARLSMANGQFLFFRASEYRRIGGHEAVKSKIMEDVHLGVNLNRRGGSIVAADLSPAVHCRMYRSVPEMWRGFAKSIFAVASFSPLAMPCLMLAGYVFLLSPFVSVAAEFFLPSPALMRNIILTQAGILITMRLLVDRRFRVPLVSLVFHPAGMAFFLTNAVYAFCRRFSGAGIEWKQREYSRQSGIR